MNASPSSRRSPGDLEIELPDVATTALEPAIAAAVAASEDWARRSLEERVACVRGARERLEPLREELARGIALETGKPITEARGELGAVLAKFDLSIADATEHLAGRRVEGGPHPAWVRRRAIGPAAVVAPFNFPLHLGNGAILAHLLAGNPVLFKPSPHAAIVAGRYAGVMEPCFPAGVFGLVQGGAEQGMALCADPRVRAVCFTGSVTVGRILAQTLAGDLGKELAVELGGRNAAIVCADADPDLAARAIAEGACLTCGQRCNATSRVLVDEAIAPALLERLPAALARFVPGDPLRDETTLGPLVSEAARDRYAHLLETAGGDWIVPGGLVDETADGKRGWYVRPALRLSGGAPFPDEETFSPVLEWQTVRDLDEAVQLHNRSAYGLSASVFTRSESRFWTVADRLAAANVYANLPTTFSPSTLPFGGWGISGNGRPGGRGFVRFATREQALQLAALESA